MCNSKWVPLSTTAQKTAAVTKELAATFAALNRKPRLQAWACLVQKMVEAVGKIDAGGTPSDPVAGPPTPFAALPPTVVAELARSAGKVAPLVALLPDGDRLSFGTELARQLIEQVDDFDGEATRAIDQWRRAGRGFASGSSCPADSPRRAAAR